MERTVNKNVACFGDIMILLYADSHEVKYVDYEPKICIGVKAEKLNSIVRMRIKLHDRVVLFGCSGWQANKNQAQFNKLYKWDGYPLVDMESEKVYELCKKIGVKFTSIRYIIDLDRGKVMPIGINHFWRIYQHRRMQLKFNKYWRILMDFLSNEICFWILGICIAILGFWGIWWMFKDIPDFY